MKPFKIVLAMIFIVAAGISNGVMDTLQFHFSTSIFADPTTYDQSFVDPEKSWGNKWKTGVDGRILAGEERFPGSSTVFVWTTDAWHLAKECMLACFRTALVLLASLGIRRHRNPWVNVLIWVGVWVALIPVFSGGFCLMYNELLVAR